MLSKKLLVGTTLAVLLILSLAVAKDKLTAANAENNPQDQVLAKLDQLIAGQQKIMDRLEAMEEGIVHEVKVRATR